eukprot:6961797-Prymnesium_polylepis.1
MKDALSEQCPVCLDALQPPSVYGMHDNALGCANGHWLCVPCVRTLVEPVTPCREACAGLKYTCPICRSWACVTRFQSLVVTKGSWRVATASFPCKHEMAAWSKEE